MQMLRSNSPHIKIAQMRVITTVFRSEPKDKTSFTTIYCLEVDMQQLAKEEKLGPDFLRTSSSLKKIRVSVCNETTDLLKDEKHIVSYLKTFCQTKCASLASFRFDCALNPGNFELITYISQFLTASQCASLSKVALSIQLSQ